MHIIFLDELHDLNTKHFKGAFVYLEKLLTKFITCQYCHTSTIAVSITAKYLSVITVAACHYRRTWSDVSR